jgi:hypothetical protein
MVRQTMRAMLAALVLGCLLSFAGNSTVKAAHPDLFYNYYNGPSASGAGTPVQMYVSPRPTPPWVGHTYITYQPLMPQEFLYHHHRKYYKYYREGGYTTACVRWH